MSKKTFKVPFDDAVKYIDAFVNGFPQVAFNEALGGTLVKDRIDGTKENFKQYRGNMAWYCYNADATPPNPKLFISFEETNEYEEPKEVREPDLEILRCPSYESIFKYQGGDIAAMLKSHQPQIGDPEDQSISKNSVIQLKNNFLKHPKLGDKNKRPYGFFENKEIKDIEKLIDFPGVEYIRYYFGYIPGKDTNEIRVILIGVDENRKNLLPPEEKKTVEELDDNDPLILQTSWPPM